LPAPCGQFSFYLAWFCQLRAFYPQNPTPGQEDFRATLLPPIFIKSSIMQPIYRQAYLDWLRIIAIVGVLFFHSAMPFVSDWGWHIKNKQTSNLLLEFNFWLHNFRMPLLFFISGTVSYFMLQKRSGPGFVGLRFRRLFIPLLFGILVIVPPQVYMERVAEGFKGNYWSFYPTLFKFIPYPKGNFSWHHLWFILYLFLYDLVCAPLFVWLIAGKGRNFLRKMNWMAKGKYIYLLTIPGILIFSGLSQKFPETNSLVNDWAYLLYWLSFLLVGFVCIASPLLMESIECNRRFSLGLAFVCIVLINYLRWNNLEPWKVLGDWQNDWRTFGYLGLNALNSWAWVLMAVGYAKKYLNKKHRILDYANQAVYPFYILHQTVIVIIAFYVVQVEESIGSKYIFVVVVSFLVSMGIYHLFIRPFAWTRLLFGMRPIEDGKTARLITPVQPVNADIETETIQRVAS
jgi:glucan biosynthesis protein C